jgi:hypothetical protein
MLNVFFTKFRDVELSRNDEKQRRSTAFCQSNPKGIDNLLRVYVHNLLW